MSNLMAVIRGSKVGTTIRGVNKIGSVASGPANATLHLASFLNDSALVFFVDPSLGDLNDRHGMGYDLQNGSTAGVDANDGTMEGVAFRVQVSQCGLSPALPVQMDGNWTFMASVLSHGTIPQTGDLDTRKSLFSVAVPGVDDNYVSVEVLAPSTEAVSNDWYSVVLRVVNNVADTVSDNKLFLHKGLVRTLSLVASGNSVVLSCLETDEAISVTAARGEGAVRVGIGCLAIATLGQFTGAADFYQFGFAARAISETGIQNKSSAVSALWKGKDPQQLIDQQRREFEWSLTQRVLELDTAGFASEAERNNWTSLMEEMSGGKNTVKWVSDGNGKYFPSIMVRIPQMSVKDVLGTGTNTDPHPAFIVGEDVLDEFFVGKYKGCSIYSNSKHLGVSLYGVEPMATSYTSLVGAANPSPTFDNSLNYCGVNLGAGWHLMTNAEWALLALWCKNVFGIQPGGNNWYGRNTGEADSPLNYAVGSFFSSNKIARVAEGTGPLSWMHDGSPWGVSGLNGNIYEWVNGFRQACGEIQVIPANNAAVNSLDFTRDSILWRAFGVDGSLVAPEVTFTSDTSDGADTGVGATLHWSPGAGDGATSIRLATTCANRSVGTQYTNDAFGSFGPDEISVTVTPETLVALGIAPPAGNQAAAHGSDRVYLRNPAAGGSDAYVETFALRAGYWNYTSYAGAFVVNLSAHRSSASSSLGARPAFVNL